MENLISRQNDFEKQIHAMFDHIWDCEIDHPVFHDTVGDLMGAVIQCHKGLPSAQPTQNNMPNALKSLDCISRQAALGYIDRVLTIGTGKHKSLEFIRCKDCKNSEPWYRDKRRCFLWHEGGIGVFEDGFCNYAERRQK